MASSDESSSDEPGHGTTGGTSDAAGTGAGIARAAGTAAGTAGTAAGSVGAAAGGAGSSAGDEPGYEAARTELAEIVRALESGGQSLEQSLALWQRGEVLAAICQRWLDVASARLDEAIAERDGPAS